MRGIPADEDFSDECFAACVQRNLLTKQTPGSNSLPYLGMMRTVGVLLDRGKKAIANAQMCTKIPRSALFGMLLLASVVLPKKVRTSNSFTQSFLSNVSWFSISPLKHVNL